jgi:Domain of unknown function (DUF1737)
MATRYYVVQSNHVQDLDDEVNKKLAEGWQLQGGVSVCVVKTPSPAGGNPSIGEEHYTYVQAMVEEEH